MFLAACGNDQVDSASIGCAGVERELKLWRGSADFRQSQRGSKVARRLADCGTLRQLTAQEVRALLGAPDGRQADGWQYLLGSEQGPFGADDEFLFIVFSRERVVTSAQVAGG